MFKKFLLQRYRLTRYAILAGVSQKCGFQQKSLLSVDDSFKKIIIVKDIIKPYCDNDGIVTIGLFDFLQNENSLEL